MSTMTIGALSRRTGIPVKILREYEDLGLIYTVGRSPGNYRLFGEDALWCVGVVVTLRGLGLTMAEIVELTGVYLKSPKEPVGPRLASALQAVRRRAEARIAEQQRLIGRIDEFEASHQAELSDLVDFRSQDPKYRKGA